MISISTINLYTLNLFITPAPSLQPLGGGKLPEKAEAAVEDYTEVVRLMEEDPSGSEGRLRNGMMTAMTGMG